MKRQFIAFFIALLACFCFVSCKDETVTPPDSNGGNTTEQEQGREQEHEQGEEEEQGEVTEMYITIGNNKLKVRLEANASTTALTERLKQGDITYTANDYGGFEVVGALGFSLPRSDVQITTQPGDVILYSGNQIVLFYGSNSWAYTRLGKIEGHSASELKTLLGAGSGNRQVTLSLE